MSTARTIAHNEWRIMWRSRVVQIAVALLVALTAIAVLTSIAHRGANNDLRARYQAQADTEFDSQPARHPHRMVHYGHFVFRPLPALAAFDPGVDGFTGNTIFLEGHRQNSANFGDVRQSSLLSRFGQLTPAFVLQVLAPLVLIFIGFGIVAREREAGTLRLLTTSGAGPSGILRGKAMALLGVAAIMLTPAALSLGWLTIAEGGDPLAALLLLAGYGVYLALWVIAVVGISAISGTARTALMALLTVWSLTAILLPRVAPEIALAAHPQLTQIETDIAIQRDLRALGDSHDPDDPHYAEFKAAVLKQYGVEREEDLPVNYNGLQAIEGEKLTSHLFDEYAERQGAIEGQQAEVVTGFGIASPAIALGRLSMALSGTDLQGHRGFLLQAEAYRFAIVQHLNLLQAEAVTYADDTTRNSDPEAGRRVRIDPEHWHDVPDFTYRAATSAEKLRAALPGAAILAGWLVLTLLLFAFAARRLQSVQS